MVLKMKVNCANKLLGAFEITFMHYAQAKGGRLKREGKNNSIEIILIGFFLRVRGDFPFPDVQKGGLSHLTSSPSRRLCYVVIKSISIRATF